MPMTEALRLAVQAIWTSKLRSFFTLLGILVSVAFLIVVVAVIQGMNTYVSGTLTSSMIGTNTFQVRRGPISIGLMDDDQVREIAKRPLVTVEDARAVAAAVPEAVAVGLQSGWPSPVGEMRYRDRTVANVGILGVTAPYQVVQDYTYLAGSPLTDQDVSNRRPVVSLGHEIAEKLFDDPLTAAGKRVRLDGRELTVKGVIAPKGRLLGQSFDAFVLLPFSIFEAAYGPRKTTVVSIKMPTAEAIESGMAKA
jgi:putative ABC transport system permease protein